MLRKIFSLGALVVVAVTFGVGNAAAKPKSPSSPAVTHSHGQVDGRFLGRSRLAAVRGIRLRRLRRRCDRPRPHAEHASVPVMSRIAVKPTIAFTTINVTRMPTLKLSARLLEVTLRKM